MLLLSPWIPPWMEEISSRRHRVGTALCVAGWWAGVTRLWRSHGGCRVCCVRCLWHSVTGAHRVPWGLALAHTLPETWWAIKEKAFPGAHERKSMLKRCCRQARCRSCCAGEYLCNELCADCVPVLPHRGGPSWRHCCVSTDPPLVSRVAGNLAHVDPSQTSVESSRGVGGEYLQSGSFGPSLGTQSEKVSWPWQMLCLMPTCTTVNVRSLLKWKTSIPLKEQAQQNSWRSGSATQEDTLQISYLCKTHNMV